ncbi:MAG TPA: Hpt domain-containing protein [Gammaproteobacteria bacterium]|nr:Hpt domain-containing protein [Gammaproteobacteria bacterium]
MAATGMINDLAAHSLDLVNRELGNTLDAARRELEDLVDGQAGRDALLRAADLLHLARGALKIIELSGPSMLAEEMEEGCRYAAALKEQEALEASLEVLTRAMVQLPAYLDRLQSGGRDVALVLLPLLNDLRQMRGKPSMSEGSLLLLNAGPYELHAATRVPAAVDAEASRRFQIAARKLRPAFQNALLHWIKGEAAAEHLEKLARTSVALENAASTEPVRQLWFVLAGVLEAIGSGDLEATVTLKRLVGQADRQLKRLIDAGEAAWIHEPPVDLLNSLLYYVGRAGTRGPRIKAIREQYRLDEFMPGEEQLESVREGLAGPSVKLMRTVAQAIKEDLASVKDALDIFVRTGMEDIEQLKPQREMLKKIGDTLGVLGLEQARAKIQRESQALETMVGGGRRSAAPGVLEKIAATLLDVEDALDRELVRAVMPDGGAPSESEAQYRHVTQAVIGECIVNLAKVKEAVTHVIDSPGDGKLLEQVKPQLRGITAGLLMLNKTKAVKVVERIGRIIETRLGAQEKPLRPEHLERLADAVVSVEYFMETVSLGRADPLYMLDNAGRCLALLEALPPARPVAVAAAPAPKPAKAPAPVMKVEEDRSDPELLELFIEEAKEEIATIQRFLPIWMERPDDSDALISVRRSFHTLKGSGRMVGAQLIGEFAWSIENLLNRLINQTLQSSPAIAGLVREAADVLPQLIEQLEAGITPRADIEGLMKRVEAVAAGKAAAEEPAKDALQLPAPGGATEESAGHAPGAAERETRSAPAPSMDPELSAIFLNEMRGHLGTIRAFLSETAAGGPPRPVDEPLYRACHTLLGSARMAGFEPAVLLARPLTAMLGRCFDAGAPLPAAGLEALRAAAGEIERMAEALRRGSSVEAAAAAALAKRLEALTAQPLAPDATLPHLRSIAGADAGGERREPAAAGASGETADGHAAAPDGFDPVPAFDPEVAGIFAEEAAEILDNAELALQTMQSGGASSESLVELQRLLHTLKGGARMAGVTAMGDLSHALETLLAGMASGRTKPTPPALALVQHCLDRLHQMRDGVESARGIGVSAGLLQRLEQFGAGRISAEEVEKALAGEASGERPPRRPEARRADEGFSRAAPATPAHHAATPAHRAATPAPRAAPPAPHGPTPAQAAPRPPDAPRIAETAKAAERGGEAARAPTAAPAKAPPAAATVDVAPPRSPAPPQAGRAAPASTPAAASAGAEARPEPRAAVAERAAVSAKPEGRRAERRAAERAETARVDAGLLDQLLNGAGEVSIFQSRLKQQLHSVEFHLGELGQTVTRLREQLRKLEAETEAQILYRHQEDAGAEQDFDPLELDRYSTIQQLSRALAETANDVASINELLQGLTTEADTLLTQQARVASELQEGLMQTRMVPFQRHVSRLARVVRQAANETGKLAELVVEGASSELDRQVLDSMLAPFEHLLRNAVVHGLEKPEARRAAGKPETGKVWLRLRREGSEVLVEVADDGAGLNLDAIRRKAFEQRLVKDPRRVSDAEAMELILRPGFSTAGELTQSAGRGVGMDVVDNEVKKLGGSLRIESTQGQGVRFLMRLPFTLAITHALIVNVGDETFALPLPTIEGVTRVPREQLLALLTHDDPKLDHGGVGYRIQHLGTLVGGMPSPLPEEESAVSLVLVRAGESSSALLADSLEGSREIVVKTLGPHIASVPGVSGATILGDGRIVMILDVGTLLRSQRAGQASPPTVAPAAPRQVSALVVDDSITMRRVTQRLLERRGVRVLTARDGLDAITVLQDQDVDVILLDIEMPRMDGYQFATHVRNDAKFKDVPIIMITSRSGEKHRAKAIEIGVNDYLSKPYQEGQLAAAIEALIGRPI